MDSELKLEQSMAAAVAQAATLVGHEDVDEGDDSDVGEEPSGAELDTAPTSVSNRQVHNGNGSLDLDVNGGLDNDVSKVVDGVVEDSDLTKSGQLQLQQQQAQVQQLQQVQQQQQQQQVDDDDIGDIELNELPEPFAGKLKEYIQKVEMERFLALTGELAYLRGYLEIVHHKIDKFTTLLLEIASDIKNQDLAHSLQAIAQDLSAYPKDTDGDGTGNNANNASSKKQQQHHHHHHLPVSLESNMDPALHNVNVAVAAVAQAAAHEQHQEDSLAHAHHHHQGDHTQTSHQLVTGPGGLSEDAASAGALKRLQRPLGESRKRKKRSDEADVGVDDDDDDDDDSERGGRLGARKPKFTVEFLHNPMSIKEIYDEFTKGFRGQIPLCEMDDKYGKHNWRGDSRSKESKRYQRRKKLCDAIHRGMEKYGKLADEVITYIETFRDNKSLTWIMNGNLPLDLLT